MAAPGKSLAPSGSSSSSSSHKHSKVSKLPAKSRPKKSSEQAGLGAAGSNVKTPQATGSGGGEVRGSKPKKKQLKYSNVGLTPHTDTQQTSAYLSLPKASISAPSVLVPTSNEPNPYNQGGNHQGDAAGQRKRAPEESSGSSSGSGSSSSSGSSSDSESEDESPLLPSFPLSGYPPGAGGGGVNVPPTGAGVVNMPSMQPPQLPNRGRHIHFSTKFLWHTSKSMMLGSLLLFYLVVVLQRIMMVFLLQCIMILQFHRQCRCLEQAVGVGLVVVVGLQCLFTRTQSSSQHRARTPAVALARTLTAAVRAVGAPLIAPTMRLAGYAWTIVKDVILYFL